MKKEEKITIKNCRLRSQVELLPPNIGVITMQAQAWNIVYRFCRQSGMKTSRNPSSGIENVIRFISKNLKSNNKQSKSKHHGKQKKEQRKN